VCGRQLHGICITLNAKSVVDALQIAVHKLQIFTAKYGLIISKRKTKTVAFEARDPLRSKIVINCNVRTKKSFSQKHNNILSNVKFATCFVYSNHYQADISVHGHNMFSATVWDPYCLHLLCKQYGKASIKNQIIISLLLL